MREWTNLQGYYINNSFSSEEKQPQDILLKHYISKHFIFSVEFNIQIMKLKFFVRRDPHRCQCVNDRYDNLLGPVVLKDDWRLQLVWTQPARTGGEKRSQSG